MRNNFCFCIKEGYIFVLLFIFINGEEIPSQSPHIIFIYADDLGWNDVSFHGSPQIPTPNIDALAMNGILLSNYYGEYMCTPSRAALLTGKYPIRLGLQHFIIKAGEASGLPLEEITMPQYLKQLGYISHMIGKWHLGYMKKEYTPIYRGFDTFFGYYNGILDYYDYTSQIITHFPNFPWFRGIDLHNGTTVIKDFRGQYATYVFTDKAKDIILSHDQSKPLFLYLSHLAVHAGNKNDPLQAPPEVIKKFKYIKDIKRRIHAAMVSVLDESVGTIIKALHSRNMLQNSIIVFASDNGGQINGLKGGYSSNYPLRGKKMTLWEGGVRVPAVIWSPLLKLKTSRVSDQLMHVSDWLPTFYSAAGGDVKKLGNIDGKSMWQAFIDNLPSPRVELLHSVDSIDGISAIRRGDWKVVNGSSLEGYDDWYGPTGTEDMEVPKSMEEWIFKNGSVTGNILRRANLWIAEDIDKWYKLSQITCTDREFLNTDICSPVQKPKLFNIRNDPCEEIDLANIHPEMVNSMMLAISAYGESVVESQSKPSDPLANPMCYEFAHVPWLDSEYASQYKNCDVWQ